MGMVSTSLFFKLGFLLQIFHSLYDEAICFKRLVKLLPKKAKIKGVSQTLFVLICHYGENNVEEFKIGEGRGGQGVAVNWDFVLLLPPVTNFFFLYLYISVTNKLYSMQ